MAAFTARALPVVRADARHLDGKVERITDLLVAMSFDAMRRDVGRIVATGVADPDLPDTIATVWIRTLYENF